MKVALALLGFVAVAQGFHIPVPMVDEMSEVFDKGMDKVIDGVKGFVPKLPHIRPPFRPLPFPPFRPHPRPTTAAPEPETPAPETPAPETAAPETPAPETPAPETPAPETPALETPAPEAPAATQ